MSNHNIEGEELWKEFVAEYQRLARIAEDYEPLAEKLLAARINRVAILHKAFSSSDQIAAIYFATLLPNSELIQLFPDLVLQLVGREGTVAAVHKLLHSLPRNWVLENIEKFTQPILEKGTYVEYRRVLGFYYELDRNLTFNLADKAATAFDPDIREAGIDFLEKLNKE